jgi:hypothetical protein
MDLFFTRAGNSPATGKKIEKLSYRIAKSPDIFSKG